MRKNKGSPGVDGMTVDELPKHLADNWETLRGELLAGTYQPSPVREKEIRKSSGGMRKLGIPTVLDRFIQQSILQVLQPIFDPTFSEHSHGFRPERSVHQVDGKAMGRVAKRITDKRISGLIRPYLEAGTIITGVVIDRYKGTHQGGSNSGFPANVILDEVDKDLEKCGMSFVRYATTWMR